MTSTSGSRGPAEDATAGGARVGIFGGTFDPPHIGHLVSALAARDALQLDRVLLVVANVPWQKVGSRPISSAQDRLAMVEAAVSDLDGLVACDVEIVRGGNSYTVETVRRLRSDDPGARYFVIMGADAALGLPTWERAFELPDLAELVLIDRPGIDRLGDQDELGDQVIGVGAVDVGGGRDWPATRVVAPRLEVSSTDLRARAHDGRSLDLLTPKGVVTFISTQGIYRGVS